MLSSSGAGGLVTAQSVMPTGLNAGRRACIRAPRAFLRVAPSPQLLITISCIISIIIIVVIISTSTSTSTSTNSTSTVTVTVTVTVTTIILLCV